MKGNNLNQELEYLRKMIKGDGHAFRRIFDSYRWRVFSYAYNLTKSKEIAEEIVQEVFIRLWQKREQIDAARDLSPYLKKITLNQVLNFLKKASRERKLQQELYDNMERIRNHTEEELLEKELRHIYREAVRKLPPQKKLIYHLSRNEALTHEQIARRLHISKNTVNNHLVEAVKFIRSYVSSHTGLASLMIALFTSGSGQ